MTVGPRYQVADGVTVCLDCGVVVAITEAHTRFHSILSAHAWSLAVLKSSHIAAHIHDKYDVVERIDSRKFDNWSADALAEVLERDPTLGGKLHDVHGGPGEDCWCGYAGHDPQAASARE